MKTISNAAIKSDAQTEMLTSCKLEQLSCAQTCSVFTSCMSVMYELVCDKETKIVFLTVETLDVQVKGVSSGKEENIINRRGNKTWAVLRVGSCSDHVNVNKSVMNQPCSQKRLERKMGKGTAKVQACVPRRELSPSSPHTSRDHY